MLLRLIKRGAFIAEIRNKIDKKMKDDSVLEWLNKDLESAAYGYVSWIKPLLILIEREQTDESVFIEYGRNLQVFHLVTFWLQWST